MPRRQALRRGRCRISQDSLEGYRAADLVRVKAVVRGRVQGVGFRAFTREQAEALGLVGCVRNVSDGSVEIIAEGEREAAERLLEILKEAFWAARVDDLHAEVSEATGEFSGFSIRF